MRLVEGRHAVAMYLSVHRYRNHRPNMVASYEIIAAELSRWAAGQSIEFNVKFWGLTADIRRYIIVADWPDEVSAMAMAVHLDMHLDVETELTRLIDDLRAVAEKSGHEFGGIE